MNSSNDQVAADIVGFVKYRFELELVGWGMLRKLSETSSDSEKV